MPKRVDASMDLLRLIREESLEPEYATSTSPGNRRVLRLLVYGFIGCLAAMSAMQLRATAPSVRAERAQLIQHIEEATAEVDTRRAEVAALGEQIDALRNSSLSSSSISDDLEQMAMPVGAKALSGPGLEISVDDSTLTDDPNGQITDTDLRQLINGLWEAGAEGIAINDHRLTALTSIRAAGSAITVDYRSLTHPYRIRAIGNPRTLPAKFSQSTGGSWWQYLQSNYGIRFQVSSSKNVKLPADSSIVLRHAQIR